MPVLAWNRLGSMRSLTLFINTTQRCNLSCSYCFERHDSPRTVTENVSVELICQTFERVMASSGTKFSSVEVVFFGGEPMLRLDKIEEIVFLLERAYCDVALRFGIVTNGTLINERATQFFLAHDFSVQISIDGNKETVDLTRRSREARSIYGRLERAAVLCLGTLPKSKVSAHMVVTPRSVAHLSDNYQHVAALGFSRVSFAPVIEEAECWTEEALAVYVRQLESVLHLEGNGLPLVLSPNNQIREVLAGTRNFYHCGVGSSMYAINWNGDLYPCCQYVYDEKPEKWLVMEAESGLVNKDVVSEIQGYKRSLILADCEDCDLSMRCHRVCFYFSKNAKSPNRDFCRVAKAEYQVVRKHVELLGLHNKWM